ncbi:MAG: hypothetical protein J5I94_21720, partial [Phaeodactylibacter sp.]|nr:hypothetical protein [Phaeodactylibacter sp.]
MLLGLSLFFFTDLATGQVLLSDPGRVYTNTDGTTFDSYGPVNVGSCTTVRFSVDYSIPAGWEGSGNMETNDECATCNGDPVNQSPDCITTGAFINGCWDFLWVRFFVDGVVVGGDLIGEAGTTDAETGGTISLDYCTNNLSNNASIQIVTQTWAMNETIIFSNVTITCIDDSPTLPALGPFCESGAPVALNPSPGGVSGTWSGPGVSGATFNPALAGDGTWNLTFTANPAACAGAATTTVTVNPAATPIFAPIGPFCQTASPAPLPTTSQNGVSGSWSGAGVNNNTFNPSTAGPGAHTLTFTPSGGSCATTATLSVTVNPAATPVFAPIGPFCQTDGAFALPTTSQNGISGSWSGAGVNNNTFNPSTAGPGAHTLTFTPSGGSCATTATFGVTINASTTPTFSSIGPFCQTGSPAALPTTSQNGISGSWSGPGVTNNTFNPAAAGAGAHILAFTPSGGSCATTATLSVQVDATITPNLTPQGPFCGTDPPVNLPTLQDGVAGSWSGPGVANNTFNPAAAGAGNHGLTFTPNAGQCANFNTLIVTVTAPATPALAPVGPFCQGDPPVALSTTQSGIAGSWSGPGINNNTFNPAAAGAGNHGLTFTPNAGQCANSNTLSVTVTASSTPALAPIGPFCQGDPPVGLSTTQSGISGAWSGPGVSNNTFNPASAGTFNLVFTPSAGQCAASNTLSVTVAGSTTPALTPIGPFCQTSPPVALPVNQSGISGSWSGPGVSNNTFNPAVSGAGAFTLTFTPNPGQCASPNSLNVTVGDIAANPAGPLIECDSGNGLAVFNLNSLNAQISQGAGTVSWFLNPGATAPVNNPNSFLGADGLQVYATVTAGPCTSAPVAVQLIVLPPPAANPASLFECETGNGTATFNLAALNGVVSGGAPVSVSWAFDPAGNTPVPNPSAFVIDDITVYAVVSDGGCQNSAPVGLTVLDAPNPNLTVATPIQCNGDGDGSLSLVVSGGQPGYSYDWNVNAYDGIQNPFALGPGAYAVTVSDANGCEGEANVTLSEPAPLTMACAVTNPVLTPGGAEGEASVAFSGGTAPFSISWVGPVNGSGAAPNAGFILISDLEEGSYTVTVEDNNGCANTCTFTVNGPGCTLQLSFDNLQPESCPGATDGAVDLVVAGGTAPLTINWNDGNMEATRTGLAAGMYSVTVDDNSGCQASNTLTVASANPAPQAAITTGDTTCENQCFVFDVQFQGTPPFVLEYEVDTGANRQLLLFESLVADTTLEVCPADYGYAEGGLEVLFTTLSDANCADTLGQLEVIQVSPVAGGAFSTMLCPGDSLFYNGTVYNAANLTGTEVLPGAAANGCDSLVSVTVGFFTVDTIRVTAQTCDPALAGLDTVALLSFTGCDSIVVTETFLVLADTTFRTDTSCDPNQVGLDTLFLQNVAGCDSLVITETVFDANAADTTFLTMGSCDPSQVGRDTVFLQNAAGCDSLVITETVLLPGDETFLTAGSCDPAAVGVDTVILQNALGCDSLVITETVLLPGDETFLTAGSCDPSAVGVDTVFLHNALGCHRLVITETVLLPTDDTFLTAGSCDPLAVGRDTVFLQNAAGCDSLVITETVLLPSDETLLTAGSCDPSQVGRDTVFLQNAAGCDSLVITETVLLPGDETFLTAGSCDPLAVGVDTVFLQNAAGCDSLV